MMASTTSPTLSRLLDEIFPHPILLDQNNGPFDDLEGDMEYYDYLWLDPPSTEAACDLHAKMDRRCQQLGLPNSDFVGFRLACANPDLEMIRKKGSLDDDDEVEWWWYVNARSEARHWEERKEKLVGLAKIVWREMQVEEGSAGSGA